MYKSRTNTKTKDPYMKEAPEYGTKYVSAGTPGSEGSIKTAISLTALKDLPHSSYALKADPYEATIPASTPYPIINRFNKTVGGDYAGDNNIDGGNVQQYANSTTSTFLNAFDVMRMKLGVNYRFIPTKPQTEAKYPGYQLIEEMRKSTAESVSLLSSTTFTQLAINNFAVETDLPMGSATTVNVGDSTTINAYTNTTDVIYACSIYYQLFLQECLSVMNWHNSFRTKQGSALRNAFDREVPNLNSFFGLMNKKAFLSLLSSINLSFEGEYVDVDFMRQLNTLTMVPSRRSDAMTDPILELQLKLNHPTYFRIYLMNSSTGKVFSDTPIFDSNKLGLTMVDPSDGVQKFIDFWTACDQLKNYLSLEATTLWARTTYAPGTVIKTDNARYNAIKSYFDVLVNSFTYFKPAWSDYRQVLDTMVRTGTISWVKGFRPGIIKDTDIKIFWNVMIDHIYQMTFSGATSVNYDEYTKRWRTFSIWNIYSGIPKYDQKQGGAFLTFSLKDFEGNTTDEQIEYLPILFDEGQNPLCVAVSRDGVEATIVTNNVTIKENPILNRLVPLLSQSKLEIRIPTVYQNSANALTIGHFSHMYCTLMKVFGLGAISIDGERLDYGLDPDNLAVYQIEVTDITNNAISYARTHAPFRGTTSSDGILGFAIH